MRGLRELLRAGQRAHVRVPGPRANRQLLHRRHIRVHERLVQVLVHEHPLGRRAHLPAVGMPRRHDRGHGHVQVSVPPDDGWRLPAQLQRHPGQVARCDPHDCLASVAVAGERHHRRQRVLHDRLPGPAVPGDQVDHTRRQVQLRVEQAEQLDRRQRRDLARLHHHGVAGDERWPELAAQHREREVPRADRADHPYRRVRQLDHLTRHVGRQRLALQPPVPLGVVTEKADREVQLTRRLPGRLADLAHDQLSEPVPVPAHHIGHGTQVATPHHTRGTGPAPLRTLRRQECLVDLIRRRAGHAGQHPLVCGIDHRDRIAGAAAPGTAEIERLGRLCLS